MTVTPKVVRPKGAGARLDAGIEGWQSVSPRLVWVELSGVLAFGIVCLALAAFTLQLAVWLGVALLIIVFGAMVFRAAIIPRRVRAIGYVLRDDDLVFRRGIFFSRLVAVPYGRMQLVDVNRGPVARLLGLSELRLVTAAATSNVTVPGLPEAAAAELRDQLIERAEERRVGL